MLSLCHDALLRIFDHLSFEDAKALRQTSKQARSLSDSIWALKVYCSGPIRNVVKPLFVDSKGKIRWMQLYFALKRDSWAEEKACVTRIYRGPWSSVQKADVVEWLSPSRIRIWRGRTDATEYSLRLTAGPARRSLAFTGLTAGLKGIGKGFAARIRSVLDPLRVYSVRTYGQGRYVAVEVYMQFGFFCLPTLSFFDSKSHRNFHNYGLGSPQDLICDTGDDVLVFQGRPNHPHWERVFPSVDTYSLVNGLTRHHFVNRNELWFARNSMIAFHHKSFGTGFFARARNAICFVDSKGAVREALAGSYQNYRPLLFRGTPHLAAAGSTALTVYNLVEKVVVGQVQLGPISKVNSIEVLTTDRSIRCLLHSSASVVALSLYPKTRQKREAKTDIAPPAKKRKLNPTLD